VRGLFSAGRRGPGDTVEIVQSFRQPGHHPVRVAAGGHQQQAAAAGILRLDIALPQEIYSCLRVALDEQLAPVIRLK